MTATLNMCGYDAGLDQSAPVRKQVREEIDKALANSENARTKRDAVCLYIAQHRITGGALDIAQYISLALYLTPPPELETAVELTEMPPDSTQVVEIVPLLRDFAAAVDSITPAKRMRIARAALSYMKWKRLEGHPIRFDVIVIEEGGLQWIQDAFDGPSGYIF